MALEDPLAIETEVTVDPPEEVANSVVPELDVERFTVSAVVDTLPKASSSSTLIGPRVALAEAAPDTGDVMNFSFAAGPGITVSCWVALVTPVAAALMVGVPARVSP